MRDGQRYQVIDKIAAGGMAEVYRGESAGIEGFRKQVAIKRVLSKLSANEEFIHMFLDEARLCAFLNHSKCVQVFDIGQAAGSHFIVMEYVDGADLKGILDYLSSQNRALSPEVALLIAAQICEGLAYAHDCKDHRGEPLNIVHRDVSPHNVLMTKYGEVKLVDFGLAKASSHLTDEDEGMVKGKFGYLAPEICIGAPADKRVDIFAAGILLWEMLAGRRLFLGDSDLETFKQVRAAEVPDIRSIRSDVNEDVARVLKKALAKDPAERYATADAYAKDLSLALVRLGKPVSYLDLAEIVRETAAARSRNKKPEKVDASAFIGDVIIEALHSFSEQRAASRLPGAAKAQSRHSFENPLDWGLDDVLGDFGVEPTKAPLPAAGRPAEPPAPAPPPQAGAAPSAPAAPVAPGPPPRKAGLPLPTAAKPGSSSTPEVARGTAPSAPQPPGAPGEKGNGWWKRWWNS
ncbi:MAG: serine/threonine-protein kinase [Polyangiaceae bacterium]|nr:serine/threonine-protein kinase [Polyangiaceae bacterium]